MKSLFLFDVFINIVCVYCVCDMYEQVPRRAERKQARRKKIKKKKKIVVPTRPVLKPVCLKRINLKNNPYHSPNKSPKNCS